MRRVFCTVTKGVPLRSSSPVNISMRPVRLRPSCTTLRPAPASSGVRSSTPERRPHQGSRSPAVATWSLPSQPARRSTVKGCPSYTRLGTPWTSRKPRSAPWMSRTTLRVAGCTGTSTRRPPASTIRGGSSNEPSRSGSTTRLHLRVVLARRRPPMNDWKLETMGWPGAEIRRPSSALAGSSLASGWSSTSTVRVAVAPYFSTPVERVALARTGRCGAAAGVLAASSRPATARSSARAPCWIAIITSPCPSPAPGGAPAAPAAPVP